MKKTLALSLTVVLLLVGAVAAAAAAVGEVRHRGQIVGDDATRVALKLIRKGGKVRRLSRFRATGVYSRCEGRDGRASLVALDPIKVSRSGNFKQRLKNPDGGKLRIRGAVRHGGRKVVGFLSTNRFDGGPGGTCRVPKQRFKTTHLRQRAAAGARAPG